MAYMTTEQAAKIRAELKEAFPAKDGWKLSVKKSSGNLGIDVTFMAGPHDFLAWDFDPYAHDAETPKTSTQAQFMGRMVSVTNTSVNHYYIKDSWTPESAAILQKASDIIHRDHWDKSDIQSDYFHCAFYVSMGIGTWEKPYQGPYVPIQTGPNNSPVYVRRA